MTGKHKRGGLGRGLGALIPTAPPVGEDADAADDTVSASAGPISPEAISAGPEGAGPTVSTVDGNAPVRPGESPADRPADVPGAQLAELPVAAIHPNRKQPRQVFDEEALEELTHSIREFGVLQPIVVRVDESDPAAYELVMGERRLRAATAAGLSTVPAIVRSTDDDAMLRDALLENIHRVALNPLEEAAAYQQLLEEFGSTHDELAARLGRSRPQVSNTIRLLNLPLAVQRRVAAGVLSAGHARALLSLDVRDKQDELAGRIVAEGLSVRATEELVSLAQREDSADSPGTARRSAGARFTAPAVAALAGDLSDAFDTRVRVDIGRRKGKITVEFGSIDDLERIVALIAPDVAQSRHGRPAD